MRTAALEIGDPENDGVQNSETESASNDFRQHVFHQQCFQTHKQSPLFSCGITHSDPATTNVVLDVFHCLTVGYVRAYALSPPTAKFLLPLRGFPPLRGELTTGPAGAGPSQSLTTNH